MLHKKRLTAVLIGIMFFMKISVPAFASYDFSESWEGGSLQISLIGNATEIAAGVENNAPVDGRINRSTSDTDDPEKDDPGTDDPGKDDSGTEEPGTEDSGTSTGGTGGGSGTDTGTGSVSGTDSAGESVQTGDFTNIEMWVIIALVALLFMVLLLLRRENAKRA